VFDELQVNNLACCRPGARGLARRLLAEVFRAARDGATRDLEVRASNAAAIACTRGSIRPHRDQGRLLHASGRGRVDLLAP
jgi:hypothetical protein